MLENSSDDAVTHAPTDLINTFKNPTPDAPFSPLGIENLIHSENLQKSSKVKHSQEPHLS